MNPALVKTSQVLASTVLAFVLGGYSSVLLGACSEVKGSTATWVVIVCCIVGIAVSVFALMHDLGGPANAAKPCGEKRPAKLMHYREVPKGDIV